VADYCFPQMLVCDAEMVIKSYPLILRGGKGKGI